MALTVLSAPNQWSSAYNPITLKLSSDVWPIPSTPVNITAVSNSGGFAVFTLSSLPAGTVIGSWLYIKSLEYNGLARVTAITGLAVTTNMPFASAIITGGTAGKGYYNYRAIINLYVPDEDGNWFNLVQLKQTAGPDGLFTFDLSSYLQTAVTKPLLDEDATQDAVSCYRQYTFTYAEGYDEIDTEGESFYFIGSETPYLEIVCSATDWPNSNFASGGTGWTTGGSTANWDFTGGNASTQMPELHSDTLGQHITLTEGEMYKMDMTLTMPTECCSQNIYVQILVEDEDGNITVMAEALAINGTMSFTFPAPASGDCIVSMRFIVKDTTSDCAECNFVVDDFHFKNVQDCLTNLFINNSVDLYNEIRDSTYPLQPWTAGTASRKWLSNYPRSSQYFLYDEDREFLSAIIPLGIGADNIIIRARMYADGAILATDDETITYAPQRVQIQSNFDAVADRFGAIPGTPDSWSLQLYSDIDSTLAPITEEYFYTRKPDCKPSFLYRLLFLTSKGDYSSFYFTGTATHGLSINRLGAYETYPDRLGDPKDYRQYGTTLTETRQELQLTSDYCPKEVIDWLGDELYRSIDVLYEAEPGFFVPVELDGTSLDKFVDNQKMYSIQVKLRYAYSDESQRR